MAGEPRDEEAGKGESLGYAVTPLHGKEEREEAGKDWRKWIIKTCFTIMPLKGQRDKGGRKKGGREKEGKGGERSSCSVPP